MEWSISPALPQAGEPFTLSVRFPVSERTPSGDFVPLELIPAEETFFPPSLQLFKGPIVQTRREKVEGKLSEFLLVSYIFVAQRAGRFVLYPAQLSLGERKYRIESFLVEVALKDPPHRVPFELYWIRPNGPYYVGQAVPLKVVAKDLHVLKPPDTVQIGPTHGGILEKVPTLFGEEPKIVQNGWVNSPIGQYLYTPYREGVQFLPSVTVRIDGIEQKIEEQKISILSLPNEVRRGSGAVGSFSIKAYLDDLTIPKGAIATLRIRIEGKGNLHWIKVPSIQVEDCTLIYEDRKSNFRPTWDGYEGWVEEAYRLVPERSGTFTVRIHPFSFWDYYQRRIMALSLPSLSFQVREPLKTKTIQNDTSKRVTLDPLPPDTRVSGWTTWVYWPWSYFLILPAIFGMIGNLVWKRGKLLPYLGGWVICLGVLVLPFSRFQQSGPSNLVAVKEFNEGVRYGREGKWGIALFHLRKAVYLSPDPVFRNSVQKVEEAYVPTFRAPLPDWVPDYWFLLGIGALHAVAIGSMVQRKMRGRGWILCLGISTLILSGVGVYRSLSEIKKPWGVVTDTNVVLRKIPSPTAQEGIPIPPGSSFYVGAEKENYVFVFLGGVKGWVEKKNLQRE